MNLQGRCDREDYGMYMCHSDPDVPLNSAATLAGSVIPTTSDLEAMLQWSATNVYDSKVAVYNGGAVNSYAG